MALEQLHPTAPPALASPIDQQLLASLTVKVEELERIVSDHAQRFDTLQTPLWKRIWFRIDGWPVRDLNAERRAWRPWH